MSKKPAYLPPTSSVKEAAKKMKQLDCGFIP
ncbi:CBS domain-containing protein, partial [Coxiella burnetii]